MTLEININVKELVHSAVETVLDAAETVVEIVGEGVECMQEARDGVEINISWGWWE